MTSTCNIITLCSQKTLFLDIAPWTSSPIIRRFSATGGTDASSSDEATVVETPLAELSTTDLGLRRLAAAGGDDLYVAGTEHQRAYQRAIDRLEDEADLPHDDDEAISDNDEAIPAQNSIVVLSGLSRTESQLTNRDAPWDLLDSQYQIDAEFEDVLDEALRREESWFAELQKL